MYNMPCQRHATGMQRPWLSMQAGTLLAPFCINPAARNALHWSSNQRLQHMYTTFVIIIAAPLAAVAGRAAGCSQEGREWHMCNARLQASSDDAYAFWATAQKLLRRGAWQRLASRPRAAAGSETGCWWLRRLTAVTRSYPMVQLSGPAAF